MAKVVAFRFKRPGFLARQPRGQGNDRIEELTESDELTPPGNAIQLWLKLTPIGRCTGLADLGAFGASGRRIFLIARAQCMEGRNRRLLGLRPLAPVGSS